MNEAFHSDELRAAVSGLAGLMGALLMPTLTAWLRLLLQWLGNDRSGLGRNPRISWIGVLRALAATFTLGFFAVSLVRASAELRQLSPEAPVFVSTVTGLIVGVIAWATFALALRALRRDWKRGQQRRRVIR